MRVHSVDPQGDITSSYDKASDAIYVYPGYGTSSLSVP